MKCQDCGEEMRLISHPAFGRAIYQCDKCKRLDSESPLEALFG